MKIGVIGVGKLGICFSVLLERSGFSVVGSDSNRAYCDEIINKTLVSHEPQLSELLSRCVNLTITNDNKEVITNSDIIFTFVQTPSSVDGGYDHSNIESIIKQFEDLSNHGSNLEDKIFVVGCTTMPGYTQTVSDRLSKYGMHVCYNPEFIAQGEIIKGLETADMVLIGSDSKYSSDKLKQVYSSFMKVEPKFNVMSNTAAEIAKISINCFLTSKISFANMIGEVCIKSGVETEIDSVLASIGDDSRIGRKYLNFGYGFGGPCLPRDNRALGRHMESISLNVNLPNEVDRFNDHHNNFLYELLIKCNTDKLLPFIFKGISYKKNVNIITESKQLDLAKKLLDNGYNVSIIESTQTIELISNELKLKYGDKVLLIPIDHVGQKLEGFVVDF